MEILHKILKNLIMDLKQGALSRKLIENIKGTNIASLRMY